MNKEIFETEEIKDSISNEALENLPDEQWAAADSRRYLGALRSHNQPSTLRGYEFHHALTNQTKEIRKS